ncbi:hypothetical protein [Streptomyces sp. NPDC060184]|uniref:hypothetical protein n=1 Tax=Streptomyces sp. NPDC060184 TaxID=3347064 RepID=UPI0036501643
MRPARTAAATVTAAALLVPATAATAATAPAAPLLQAVRADQPVGLRVQRGDVSAVLSFSGRLSWSGAGHRTYTLKGRLLAHCHTATRFTVRLQYGGSGEGWKNSPETACSNGRSRYHDIALSGTLAPHSGLRLRLGTWTSGSWVYSGRKNYAHPA